MPVVQPVDSVDDPAEFYRNVNVACAAAVFACIMTESLQLDIEGLGEIANGSLEPNAAFRNAGLKHFQVVCATKPRHGIKVLLAGAVGRHDFLLRKLSPFGRQGERIAMDL